MTRVQPTRRTLEVCFTLRIVKVPKMKTHSGAKKRFKLTAKGKGPGAPCSYTSHILEKKSPKRKRHLGRPAAISEHNYKQIKTLLGAKRS